jgi:hypothetical protein
MKEGRRQTIKSAETQPCESKSEETDEGEPHFSFSFRCNVCAYHPEMN